MEVFLQVLVSIALVALGVAVYFQGKTIVVLRGWIELLERRLDSIHSYAECVNVKADSIDRVVGQLEAKVEHLEKEVRR